MSLFAPTRLFPPTSILASAGSGKTYQLASRYVGLVVAGAPVGSILATTFTRVAAGEIRDRILMRLVSAAEDDDARTYLARTLGLPQFDRGDVMGVLREVTTNLHQLEIRTIDSFFAAVVQAFAIELGVPTDSVIVDETVAETIAADAIARLLDAEESDAFVKLLRLLTQGDAGRSVVAAIDGVVQSLSMLARDAVPTAWSCVPRGHPRPGAEVEVRLEELRAAGVYVPARHRRAFDDDCARAQRHEWEAFLDTGLAKKISRGESVFSRVLINPEVIAAYEPVIDHARAVLIEMLRVQTEATGTLLALYERYLTKIKRERHALTFDDLTFAMTDAQRLGCFDEMCYRIDATLRHLLLDEFQDTSAPQWRAFAPIARELLADETEPGTFLCVGDVKQSIYGWRGACPEVVDEVPGLLLRPDGASAVVEERLHQSRRSAPAVIDLVNSVFGALDQNPALTDSEDAAPAARRFAERFETHATVRENLAGYVELRTAPEGLDKKTVRFEHAAALVARLHRDAPGRSIGVLTRSNEAVSRLLYEFGPTRLGLPASGRGGGPLTDTPAVNAILDLLVLADHPDDRVAAFHVAHCPLGRLVDLDDADDAPARREASRRVRDALVSDGYAATIAGWVDQIGADADGREMRRLEALIELAEAYEDDATLRPGDFIQRVEREPVAETTPAAVQVMTLHQAKGLEFDIVVLPELDTPLMGRTPTVAYERAGVSGPITRICRWVNKSVLHALPELAPLFSAQRERQAHEGLCLLYVAITRARQGVLMVIDPTERRSLPVTAAGVLRAALTDGGPLAPDVVVFTDGDGRKLHGGATPPPLPPMAAPRVTLAPPRRQVVRVTSSTAPSAHASRTLADAISGVGDDEARVRGRVVHALFEAIGWIEDGLPTGAALERCVARAAPRRSDAWRRTIIDDFLMMIDRPAIRDLLSRASAGSGTRDVWRERTFARREPETPASIQVGTIDRLIATADESGTICAGVVIDFKTDAIDAASAPTAAEGHRPQLEAYRAAAARLLGLETSDIEMKVAFVEPGVVVRL